MDERIRIDAYLSTVITTDDGVVIVGPGAGPFGSEMVHVITAENPGSARAAPELNAAETARLDERLRTDGFEPRRAVGSAPDGHWSEHSFVVEGLFREQAWRIGREFAQTAVFEVASEEVRVIRCTDGEVLAQRSRVHDVTDSSYLGA